MKYLLVLLVLLLFPTAAEARCRGGACRLPAKVAAAPVKVVAKVKPVRRVAVLPVKVLRCRRG
jgi:hypothetical protein